MGLNLETKETHWYVDGIWVMREKSDVDHNLHDSAETTYHAICAYGLEYFSDPAANCMVHIPPLRYPVPYPGMQKMSRDHVTYHLCNLMETYHKNYIENYIPSFVFDKGAGSAMTLQMYFWTKIISGKKIGVLFYPVALMQAVKNSLWNQMLNRLFRYSNKERDVEVYNEFIYLHNKKKASLYYPVYAIKLVATMLQYTRKNWFSKQIKKQLLKITPEKNFALKIMLGDKYVTEDDVVNFRPINKPRWSQMINTMRNNRTFRYLTEEEMAFNCVDKDYLMYLWNKREDFYE